MPRQTMKFSGIFGLILAVLVFAAPVRATGNAVEALSGFASRAEFQTRIGNVSLVSKPSSGDIDIQEREFFLGEPHGTGFFLRRARSEVNTARIRPMISIGETRGGQWRIPVSRGALRAVIPGYAERRVIENKFDESTNIPNVYNKLGISAMQAWSYSLGSRWKVLDHRTLDFTFIETKVRGSSTCTASFPDCRPSMRSDIWRVEMYPDNPDRLDWNVRLERHDRERFSKTGYVVRLKGEYDFFRGLKAGLTLGANVNGMTPAGDEFSEIATHLVFEYLNGSSTSFKQFYTESFGYYKITLGYDLEF